MTGVIDDSQRKAAKVAGAAYLISFASVVFAEFRIGERLFVPSAAETARNVLAHERLFRVGIACNLFYCVGVLVLLTALYVVLRPVSRGLAAFAAVCRLVYAMVWVEMSLKLADALRLFSNADYLQVFGSDRVQALGKLAQDKQVKIGDNIARRAF